MEKFTVHSGLVAPLDRDNVDTDAIIPKQFLKSIKRTGFGPNAFDEWRYLDVGQPGQDNSNRPLNPDFVLNQPRYKGASILLPIVLTESQVDRLFNETYAFNGFKLTVDLERQVVLTGDGTEFLFEVPGFRKFCLLNGFDDIALTLRHADKIHQFENERLLKQPWLNNRLVG